MKLKVTFDGKVIVFTRAQYVAAKTKQLREFGYSNLTEVEVDEQITASLTGKQFGKGLTVVGMFIQKEIEVV